VKNRKNAAARPAAPPPADFGPAFLLAQIGSHAARRFAERIAKLRLTPAHSGILHILAAAPGLTQQALSGILGMVPSRLVALLDELDALGLTERRRSENDRRRHALALTDRGRRMLASIGEISRQHQRALLAALTEEERAILRSLLQRVADEQGLTRNVHPGYRTLSPRRSPGRAPRISR
jgi:DNA-binding MarR family transcriptional regulator